MQCAFLYGEDVGWQYAGFADKPSACMLVLKDADGKRCEYIYARNAKAESLEGRLLEKLRTSVSAGSASYEGGCRVYRWNGHKYGETKSGKKRIHLAVVIPAGQGGAIVSLSADCGYAWEKLVGDFMENYNIWAAMLEEKMGALK